MTTWRAESEFNARPRSIFLILFSFSVTWIGRRIVLALVAIAKLQKLGLFDIQDKGFSIRNLTGASTLKSVDEKTSDQKLRKGNLKNETSSVSKIRLESQNCKSSLKNETGFSKMRLDSQICDNRPPESPPDKAFKSPQTIQTYTDFSALSRLL